MTTVFWTPYVSGEAVTYQDMTYFEPESVLSKAAKSRPSRSDDADFIRCPGFISYTKNLYCIKSPYDMTFNIDPKTKRVESTDMAEYVRKAIVFRSVPGVDSYLTISLTFFYLFFSEDSVIAEQLPAFFEHPERRQFTVVPGEFNIGKWVRPFEAAIEVHPDVTQLVIKRGDPLFYCRFRDGAGSTIKIKRVEMTPQLEKTLHSCTHLKKAIPWVGLSDCYDMARLLIKRLFGKGCPFRR